MEFSTWWNQQIARLPGAHFLQTAQWAQVKAAGGWQAHFLTWDAAGFHAWPGTQIPALQPPLLAACLVLQKRVPVAGLGARLCLLYAPKGPLLNWNDAPLRLRVLNDLQTFARRQGAIFLKMDPDVPLTRGRPGSGEEQADETGLSLRQEIQRRGWQFSPEQIQFRNTVLLPVNLPDEDLLARMKPKTRYNLRLAQKKGVSVRPGSPADWPLLYRMYAETARRDAFLIREESYYRQVWQIFHRVDQPLAQPLLAEVDGEVVAAVYLFAFAGRAYYVYGMSRDAHRDKMPNYLLQWEAIRWARAQGCAVYDLWGAPDVFDETDRMWGVYRFKEGLGGETLCALGAWDYAPNPLWYNLYTRLRPQALKALRSWGRRAAKGEKND